MSSPWRGLNTSTSSVRSRATRPRWKSRVPSTASSLKYTSKRERSPKSVQGSAPSRWRKKKPMQTVRQNLRNPNQSRKPALHHTSSPNRWINQEENRSTLSHRHRRHRPRSQKPCEGDTLWIPILPRQMIPALQIIMKSRRRRSLLRPYAILPERKASRGYHSCSLARERTAG